MSQQLISPRLQQSRRKHEQRRAAKRLISSINSNRHNKYIGTLTVRNRGIAQAKQAKQAKLNRSKLHAS